MKMYFFSIEWLQGLDIISMPGAPESLPLFNMLDWDLIRVVGLEPYLTLWASCEDRFTDFHRHWPASGSMFIIEVRLG